MDLDEDSTHRIPEWVVTFGDMMSLLLTFFIMLVSLSEIKEEEKYQALVESLRQQFGYTRTLESLTPGESRPRTTSFDPLATVGRAMKKDVARGGVPEPAPHGEERHVRIVRPGRQTAIGSVVFFDAGSDALTAATRQSLERLAERLRGKPQKIEIRGHTAPEVAARSTGARQVIQLGHSRACAVFDYLVNELGLDETRFRVVSAGASEPMDDSGDPDKMSLNARVEVFLLDETTEGLRGSTSDHSFPGIAPSLEEPADE